MKIRFFKTLKYAVTTSAILVQIAASSAHAWGPTRWTEQRAKTWTQEVGWLAGANYLPASAVNQLEMWQADTFDMASIDRELNLAQKLGMHTMRVFLHDLPWQQDADGFRQRIDTFLTIADKHHIRPIFVFFDSCWNPVPTAGKQPAPRKGVHNSQWVQSPGLVALQDQKQNARLKDYVRGVIKAFATDKRILAWDLWNEPDNTNVGSYNDPNSKLELVEKLLPQVFSWARSAHPTQPLTSGVWGDWLKKGINSIQKIQLEDSDVISFHNYDAPDAFEAHVKWLMKYKRPLICTEYMARPLGSTFQNIMPIAKKYNVSLTNWGFVAGKSQTYIPWNSWQTPDPAPQVWFHDIFTSDGKPYDKAEAEFIQQMTAPSRH